MTVSLNTLPTELFRFIIRYLSPEDASALSQTCRILYSVTSDDHIWQNYFLKRYTYPSRTIRYSNEDYLIRFSANSHELPTDVNTWKKYFEQRSFLDRNIRILLKEMMTNRINRIRHGKQISSEYGLFAIDFLTNFIPIFKGKHSIPLSLRNLTREYYSLEIVRLTSREIGLELLNQMKNEQNISPNGKSLINALSIIQCFHPFGLFTSVDRIQTIGEALVKDPIYLTLNLNEKCQRIITTMKQEKFLPANGDHDYYDLENSFLYSTFNGKPTIPLTLVAIFCALADECGLVVRPIGFPGEVMAQVQQSIDDLPPIIISVFEGKILTLDEINQRLTHVIDRPFTHPLPTTQITELVVRSARNMINSITGQTTSTLNPYGLYTAVSILKIFGGGGLPFAFDSILNVLKEHFPMDINFYKMLTAPTVSGEIHQIENQDSIPLPIKQKRRVNYFPKYNIGQIFKHQEFEYYGIICGWDLNCMASVIWQERMGIGNLSRGSTQPFYHVLADDSSNRYVAEDNINIFAFQSITNKEKYEILEKLSFIDGIGKLFENVDVVNFKFIPNHDLICQYPDD